jgi:hypothetical protein
LQNPYLIVYGSKAWLFGLRRVHKWKLLDVSADITVSIFRLNESGGHSNSLTYAWPIRRQVSWHSWTDRGID